RERFLLFGGAYAPALSTEGLCVRLWPRGRCARATSRDRLRIERARQNLRDVFDAEVILRLDCFDAILEHRDAERAGRRHRLCPGVQRLLHARVVDALA